MELHPLSRRPNPPSRRQLLFRQYLLLPGPPHHLLRPPRRPTTHKRLAQLPTAPEPCLRLAHLLSPLKPPSLHPCVRLLPSCLRLPCYLLLLGLLRKSPTLRKPQKQQLPLYQSTKPLRTRGYLLGWALSESQRQALGSQKQKRPRHHQKWRVRRLCALIPAPTRLSLIVVGPLSAQRSSLRPQSVLILRRSPKCVQRRRP